MFIALQNQYLCAPAERYVLWVRQSYIPLLKERDRSEIWGYKHVAPPEQEPSISMMTTFGKANLIVIPLLKVFVEMPGRPGTFLTTACLKAIS
jgi:hypothetical protein